MKCRQIAALSLMVTLASCAEGGSRGSGIGTFIEGNVASVEGAPTQTAIQGIRVAIADVGIEDETDADGNFVLEGDYEGDVTVVFRLPDSDGTARIGVNVPAAGTLTLNNLHLSVPTDSAIPERVDVEFDGVVIDSDCRNMTLILVSAQQSPPDSDQYTLRLGTSSLQDAAGNSLSCEAVRNGARASVQGLVNADGTFGYATVRIAQ